GVAAPAALAHDHGVEIHAERFADARLDAAVGGAAADHQRATPQHTQQLGDAGPIEGAWAALEKDVVLGTGHNLLWKSGLRRALDAVRQRRRPGLDAQVRRQ